MVQTSSNDGFANNWHLVHLGSRAVGGAGPDHFFYIDSRAHFLLRFLTVYLVSMLPMISYVSIYDDLS